VAHRKGCKGISRERQRDWGWQRERHRERNRERNRERERRQNGSGIGIDRLRGRKKERGAKISLLFDKYLKLFATTVIPIQHIVLR
jgi:hypothetical protein